MFYVYRIFDSLGDALYIGKGSGSRLASQKSRFGFDGEIVARFENEADAYAEERRLIAKHKPPLNKHPGGYGGTIRKTTAKHEMFRMFAAMFWHKACTGKARLLGVEIDDEEMSEVFNEALQKFSFESLQKGFSKFNINLVNNSAISA